MTLCVRENVQHFSFLISTKYGNALTSHLNKAKTDYYQNTFEIIYDNHSKIWEAVNALTGTSTCSRCIEELTVNDESLAGKRLADAFNANFIMRARTKDLALAQTPH